MAEHADEPTEQEGAGAGAWLMLSGMAALIYAGVGALITTQSDGWGDISGASQFSLLNPFATLILLGVAAMVASTRV